MIRALRFKRLNNKTFNTPPCKYGNKKVRNITTTSVNGEEKWWKKRYYGAAYQHRMQLAWGSSVAILFCGMPLVIHMNQKEKRSRQERKKNASTYIRDITVNPRVLSEEEKLRLHMMGVGHSKKKMKEFVQRMKKIEEDKEEKEQQEQAVVL